MWHSIEKTIRLRINAHNIRVLFAELIGTCMIVLFGCGSVCASLSGAYKGIWQIAVIWGLGVSFAIYCTASISNAHLNPAVSLAFFLWRPDGTFKLECTNDKHKIETKITKIAQNLDNPIKSSFDSVQSNKERKVNISSRSRKSFKKRILSYFETHVNLLPSLLMYSLFQLLGGILGGMLNLAIFSSTIASFEKKNNITRGDENSILTAKAFGEYFPNPDLSIKYNPNDGVYEQTDVTTEHGLFIEAWGTFVLVFVIFVLTSAKNSAVKMKFGGERLEDMKKNMYCVCVELDDKNEKVEPDEQKVLLENVNEESLTKDNDRIDKSDVDPKCCGPNLTSTQINNPNFKEPSTLSARKLSIANVCHPISTDTETKSYPNVQSIPSVVIPGLIGFTVAMNLALYAPLTQAGWNPARDFGPRIVAYFAGWGNIAIPGPKGGFWIYILGPYIGGIVAGFFSEKILYGFKS